MTHQLVCFDLDGTIIDDTEFIWYTLHEHFGVDRALVKEWHRKFVAGEITYDQWFAEDMVWWRACGARREGFVSALKKLRLMPGARETLAELKRRNMKLAIISGSLNIVVEHFFPDHPFDYVFVNSISFDSQGTISGHRVTPYDYAHKATGVRFIAEKEDIPLSASVFVGDHENDIEAVKLCGLGISFNSKSKELDRVADVIIKKKDLREILPHLTAMPTPTMARSSPHKL
jgi:phosphoserine phosphatase